MEDNYDYTEWPWVRFNGESVYMVTDTVDADSLIADAIKYREYRRWWNRRKDGVILVVGRERIELGSYVPDSCHDYI